jgi:hypothetical protein
MRYKGSLLLLLAVLTPDLELENSQLDVLLSQVRVSFLIFLFLRGMLQLLNRNKLLQGFSQTLTQLLALTYSLS